MGTDFFGLFPEGFYGISRADGLILLAFFILFLIYSFWISKQRKSSVTEEEYKPMKIWKAITLIIIGLAGLTLGGNLIVDNAITIAQLWGIPEAIIGVTIVSLGTSLPELATSAVAAYRKNTDLAIGNIIGSNIFNVFFVLSVSSIIYPLSSYPGIVVDAGIAAGSSLLLWLFVAISKKRQIGRLEGIIMLALYAAYLYWIISGL